MKPNAKVLTANEIRNLNLSENDTMSYDYLWVNGEDNYYLVINGERKVSFTTAKLQRQSFDKIRRMGFCWKWVAPKLTDEEEGIIQAAANGENPFAYTIMCANPELNESVPVKKSNEVPVITLDTLTTDTDLKNQINEAIQKVISYETLPPQIDYTRPYLLKSTSSRLFIATLPEDLRMYALQKIENYVTDYFESGYAELDAKF